MQKMTELMSDVDNCVDITCLRHNIFILITVICITKQIVLIFYILVMTSSERRCSKVYHLYIEHQIEHSYRHDQVNRDRPSNQDRTRDRWTYRPTLESAIQMAEIKASRAD